MEKKILASIISILIVIMILFSFNFDVTTSKTSNETLHYTNKIEIISPVEDGVTSSSVSALNNSYLSFDGLDDYVNITNSPSLNFSSENSFSISSWVYSTNCSADGDKRDAIFNSLTKGRVGLIIDDDCSIQGGIRNSTYSTDVRDTGILINMSKWEYVVMTYNSSIKNLSFYKNAILVANYTTTVISDDYANYYTLSKGSIAGNNGYLTGQLDELRLYNTSLTDAQITEIYNSGRYANESLPSDGLVAWYSFNSANGSIIYDSSNSGNHGVLYG